MTKAKCPLHAGFCEEHGFVHGHEAEELRKGLETALEEAKSFAGLVRRLYRLLDAVDARDSVAFLETPKTRRRAR